MSSVGPSAYLPPMPSVRHLMALRLAAAQYRYPGARDTDAHELLGWSPVRFWQVVDALLDDPAAMAAMPVEVNRLRRLREARRRARAA